MKEFLNENTLFNTLAMFIKDSRSLLLVVEGDDDHLVLNEHCSSDLRLLAGTGGREQVLRAASLALERDVSGVRFLVDRDYDDFLESPRTELANVWVSARHDLFLDLVASDRPALRRVIDVHSARARRRPKDDKANSKPLPTPDDVESAALNLAAKLSAVRIVDARRGLSLDFTKFSFGGLKATDFDVAKIAETVLVRSGHVPARMADMVHETVSTYSEINECAWELVGDHDFFSALARTFKQFNVSISKDTLQKAFIIKVSCSTLVGTEWFEPIQIWCAQNRRKGFSCTSEPPIAA